MRVIGEPSPAISQDDGTFDIYTVSFEYFDPECRLRVRAPGYEPLEAKLTELAYRTGPETRMTRVDVHLRRVAPPRQDKAPPPQ
jgi:hypothetical protein